MIEGTRESRFDKDWNREGYSIHREDRVENFSPTWERQGYDEIFEDESEETEDPK